MNGALGHAGVMLGFLSALFGAASLAWGTLSPRRDHLAKQAPAYVWLLLVGALLATFGMERALLTHDFSLQFVASNNSRSTPLLFTISGMWSALQGSILLWGLVLAVYIASMAWHFRSRRDDAMVRWATVVALVVATFFFGLMLGPADPFTGIAGGVVPADGAGPNPLLQDYVLMAFHPPILYAGYVGFTIPFSFGVAALITGRLGEGWLVEARRWTLVAWGLLTLGIGLGSWWSYETLGWGGYWAWDPVENASFLPWLTATAYLHSVMVQERRGILRVWNLSLLAATFSLTVLGTYLTRSGVLDSVHAFTESPIGMWLIVAFAMVVLTSCGLIFWRGEQLGSPGSISSWRSRESAFLLNNLAFAAFAFVVLLGTVFPLLTEAVNGDRISVGSPYFNSMVRPIGLVLLFLMAVAPALPWKGTTADVLSSRLLAPFAAAVAVVVACVALGVRGGWLLVGVLGGSFVVTTSVRQLVLGVRRAGARALVGRAGGGMVAHIGLAVLALGLVASQHGVQREEVSLRDGEAAVVAGHRFTFEGLSAVPHRNRTSTVATVQIDGHDRYRPSLSKYPNSNDAIGRPSVRTGLTEDVYLTLVRTPAAPGDPVVLSVVVQPMVSWLWTGIGLIVAGTVLALLPGRGLRARSLDRAPLAAAGAGPGEGPGRGTTIPRERKEEAMSR